MQNAGIAGFIYNSTSWIIRFVYVNILWISFTALGLILFGFFPATAAMFSIVRKWIMGNHDIPIFKTFLKGFRSEFMQSNILGLILIVIGYILYIDYMYIQTVGRSLATLLAIILIMVSIVYLIMLLYIFPIVVHYQLKTLNYLKIALMIGLASPLATVLMIIGLTVIYFLIKFIPGLTPFFLGICVSYTVMWGAFNAIRKVEMKNGNG